MTSKLPETTTASPAGRIPLFGMTMYLFGTVTFTLNAIRSFVGFLMNKLAAATSDVGPVYENKTIMK